MVKDWKGSNFQCNKYSVLNKILVYYSVQFYKDYWKYRNEEYHDPLKQRNRILEWYHKLKNYIERNESRMVNMFIRRHQIEVNNCNTETIKCWIYNAKEVMKKAEKIPKNDIRRYFEY